LSIRISASPIEAGASGPELAAAESGSSRGDAVSENKDSSPVPSQPQQPNPGMPGFAGQPPMGQPGQGSLDNPDLMPPKEGEQRPD
jgi:hypothetical protein